MELSRSGNMGTYSLAKFWVIDAYICVACRYISCHPQGGIGLNVAQMIVELIRDKRKIVDRINQHHVDRFIELLCMTQVSQTPTRRTQGQITPNKTVHFRDISEMHAFMCYILLDYRNLCPNSVIIWTNNVLIINVLLPEYSTYKVRT